MKRTYSKPYLLVESFQLDAAIAASCSSEGGVALNHAVGTCWNNTDDKYFFNADYCDVDLTGPEDDGGDTLCYHGPTLAGRTFITS